MKKTALILGIIIRISKVVGFLREITLSYFYGASYISDAYLISLSIPGVLFGLLATGIATGYIPMYTSIEENQGLKEANRYTNNIVNILMLISAIAVLIGLLFTRSLVTIFASGFTGETMQLAINFTRITLFGIFFTALTSIFNGFLEIKGKFFVPAMMGFPLNFIIIASIFISAKTSPLVMAFGSLLAFSSQLIFMIPAIKKTGYKYKRVFKINDEHIKKMAIIALPLIIGASVNEINIIVDKTIASNIAVGAISTLNYAKILSNSIVALFVSTVVTVIYPSISRMAAKDNLIGLKATVGEAINSIMILIIPATFGLMLYSYPITKLIYARGAFSTQALDMTSGALFYYSIGIFGYALRHVLFKVFYAMQDTKTPMINGSIAVSLNIVLNIILSRFMGVNGLALATSISALVSVFLLFISLRKKIGQLGLKNISYTFLKIFLASAFMGIISRASYSLFGVESNISLVLAILVGVLSYVIIIYNMRIKEVDNAVKGLKNKL